ncbi:BtrH N-terminal domain-containing protein [Goodfellowiella coeruleoviolacea]|uniref:Butirosin biosynthesis protein H, N-terminal n=1 Tax=Goodfellowiella coeruleoviolacea TaxID=334858 RepID=A0AAE3GI60_9PSEU|nr:BtrH N-terminal domain-containing protein [Goodfellowiella coeruleoviolacea]MCP2168626.1 Butirosin biosynthesis protein H, N-terminal [Goodfellowiella coeruleoviolacea]
MTHRDVRSDKFTSLDHITASYGTLLAHTDRDPAVLGDDWGYHLVQPVSAEWPLACLRITRRPPEATLRFWYGLGVTAVRHASGARAWTTIRRLLDNGQPAIVPVDAFHLPHSAHHRMSHHAHRVVLTGYAGSEVTVVDSHRENPFAGAVRVDTLTAAMGSDELAAHRDEPDWRHCVISVLEPPEPDTTPLAARPAQLAAALDRNTRAAVPGDPRRTARTGRSLLRECADALRVDAPALAGLSPEGLAETRAWCTAVASQRALNARFLRVAAEALGRPGLHDCAERAERLARRWCTAGSYLYVQLPRKRTAAVLGVAGQLEEIAALEALWCGEIRRALAG